jgi:ABC-2 type transport system ATP-binding protein
MQAIESFSLSKLYPGSKIPALSQITLSVPEGRIFTLLGRNGAGKTTFLRISATQLLPTKGKVNVLGHEIVTEARQIRSKKAVVPQEGSTVGPLTAWDHVFLSLLAR